MKTPPSFPRLPRHRGFALITTLSLMVLLTVIAVGLLALSSISLRVSSQQDAMATARSNARMALILAIGDLQKLAGPDQRITARADIDPSNSANPRLTGVWNSWEIQATNPPSSSDFGKSARDGRFLGWLASSPDSGAAEKVNFPGTTPANPATLWGEGSLGTRASSDDLVSAAKVPVPASRGGGAYAWAVMDEGVKVRVNTPYVEEAGSLGRQISQLGSGSRPKTSTISALSDIDTKSFEYGKPAYSTIEKGISRLNFGLASDNLSGGAGEQLKPLTHDVTSVSSGLLTNTASGGLKQDLNLLSNLTQLPSPYSGQGIYSSLLGMSAASAPSDPRWESFHQFSRIYRETTGPLAKLTNPAGVPVLKSTAPTGWSTLLNPSNPNLPVNRNPPPGIVMAPVIAKVQVVFSLIGRDLYPGLPANISGPLSASQKAGNMHGPQDGHFRNTRFDYDLHLLYTPVVTLHNPYNVALEFTELRVEFVHVPFSMKVYRNGQAQSTDFVPLATMYGDNWEGIQPKIFGLNLKPKQPNGMPATGNAAAANTIRLMPGEVKLFSPWIPPGRTYQQDLGSRTFWDIYVNTGITNNIDAISGWRGDGIGFDCDNLAGGYAIDGIAENGRWGACLGLAWNDRIHVEFIPKSNTQANNRFRINMSAKLSPTSSTRTILSTVEFDYERPTGLMEFIEGNSDTKLPMRYPKEDAQPNYVLGLDLVDRASRAVSQLQNVKPFALLTAQAKTTSGGRDPSGEDGRLATKPWAFAHANANASSQKVLSEHSANFSHEIDLQPLDGSTANLLSVDSRDRSNFISGHNSFNGTKFAAQYDVPLAPLQTLVGLNGANPGGSSGYLPRFARPIGNSWAHPLINPSQISTPGASYPYLDHSFLLNLALFDRFYFSGLADRAAPFDSPARPASNLAENFIDGIPLSDPRLALYTPDGQSPSDFPSVVADQSSHTRVAAWQMMNGAFNINSTSVTAWKAMLASIHDSRSIYSRLVDPPNLNQASTTTLVDLPSTNDARISRFRLPASESAANGGDPVDSYWLGPREYSDADLERLAVNIVDQIQERGPFLSMAEFVNRRLGPSGDDMSQRGALQQAIDNSGLNHSLANGANAGFQIPAESVMNFNYANPAAGAGSSYQGAPGYLSQSDLLAVLGNAATPRSDTFTIRGYGEARDTTGKPIATAVCEAVVQRVPDYLDPADTADTPPSALGSSANQIFGRRFQMVSFRWLSAGEV